MINYSHWFIRARLKTRQLLLLVALAEEGNIHRAAEVLNMTQPGASKLLKDLEDVLGVTLFDRLPRGMRATVFGEAMIRHARTALSSLNKAHDEVQALKTGHFGQVNVGAITTPGLMLLPQAIARVKQDHPTLRVSLQVETSDVLMERMEQGRLDVLVARLFAQHDKTAVRFEAMAEEPAVAIVRAGHPLLAAGNLTLRDLSTWGWIVPPEGSVLRHRFDVMFSEAALDSPVNLIETAALLFVTKMIGESDLIGLVAGDVGRYYALHKLVAVLPIDLPCRMDAFGVITRTDRPLSPAAGVVLAAIKSAAAESYGVPLDGADPVPVGP
jgi:DNA-binding transcriptional LysR family regulator